MKINNKTLDKLKRKYDLVYTVFLRCGGFKTEGGWPNIGDFFDHTQGGNNGSPCKSLKKIKNENGGPAEDGYVAYMHKYEDDDCGSILVFKKKNQK